MVKYEYNVEQEVFRRADNRGVPLRVNIVEARRIKSMMDLGLKANTIIQKIDFVNRISITTLRTIMNNIEKGNINLEGDYPIPTNSLADIDYDIRISNLERRVESLEDRLVTVKSDCPTMENSQKSAVSRWKEWLRK